MWLATLTSEDEALEYFDSEVSGSPTRPSARTTRSSFTSSLVRGVANAASALFSASSDQRKLPATESSKVDKALAGASQSIAKFFPKLQHSTASTSKSVVEIDDPSQPSLSDEQKKKPVSPSSDWDAKASTETAMSVLEAKKTAVLLTYPYEDSESTNGKISVTYGDIARLAPGEFLNDNIIDFYLRCVGERGAIWSLRTTAYGWDSVPSGGADSVCMHDDCWQLPVAPPREPQGPVVLLQLALFHAAPRRRRWAVGR